MPAVDVVPVGKPMQQQELLGRLQRGWTILGQVLLRQSGGSIATPDNPDGVQAIPVTVWVLPEPTVPLSELISAVLSLDVAVKDGSIKPYEIIDEFSKRILGAEVEELRQGIENADREQRGSNAPLPPTNLPG